MLGGENTRSIEIISTLYAVWNDFLIDAKQPSDDEILNGFWFHWHKAKQSFPEETCLRWLSWMRRHDLTPKGQGPHTRQQMGLGI